MVRIHTLEDLQREAERLLTTLSPREEGATLITLSGELGAGKTAFTKMIAKTLGVVDEVTSPTFVLEKIYALPKPMFGFSRLVHIDAYRLKGGGELSALGFDEVMKDTQNLIVCEWPEQVEGALPIPGVAITLAHEPDGSRTITYD